MSEYETVVYGQVLPCAQCGIARRVTEANAFHGRDKHRSSLVCGHVVNKRLVR